VLSYFIHLFNYGLFYAAVGADYKCWHVFLQGSVSKYRFLLLIVPLDPLLEGSKRELTSGRPLALKQSEHLAKGVNPSRKHEVLCGSGGWRLGR
jgi:hypothetical protein